jgi:hypothetical protein
MQMKLRNSSWSIGAGALSLGAMLGTPLAAGAGTVVNFHNAANAATGAPNFLPIIYSGQGAFSDPGNNVWNPWGPGFNPGANGANTTSTGAASPITLTLSPNLGNNGGLFQDGPDGNGGNTHQGTPFFLLGHCSLVNDANPGAGVAGAPQGTFALNNVPSATYDLYLYSSNYDGDRGAVFTVSNGAADSGITGTVNAGQAANNSFTLGTNYVVWHNVTPVSGTISGTWIPNPASTLTGEGNFNGLQLVTPTVVVIEPEWGVNSSGDWSIASNWIGGVPNGTGAVARLLNKSTLPHTTFTDAAITLGTLRMENTATYVVGGLGSLTIQVATGSGSINASGGSHKINVPLIVASNTTINSDTGATLRISDPVTVNANRTVLQSGTGNVLYESTVNVLSGGGIQFRSSSHMNSLTLAASSTATLLLGGSAVPQKIDSVSLNSTATFDLADNDLVTGTSRTTIENLVRNARNSGAWNLPGITSSTARDNAQGNTGLGVVTGAEYNSVGGTGTFGGRPYVAGDTLVKYTWNGDANISGTVNFDDYVRIDVGFNTNLTGWINGDFNYSGAVNFDDYVLIDVAFNTQSGTLGRAVDYLSGDDRGNVGLNDPAVKKVVEHFDQFGVPYAAAFLAAVPEPAGLGILGCAIGSSLLARRRRAVS